MDDQRLYVETVNDEVLSLSEDLANLRVASHCLERVSPVYLKKDRKYEVLGELKRFEREITFYIRHCYLEGKTGKIYDSLRERLKLELESEVRPL